jgi:tRNA threonylcarbamoyl adenosine modification protein (Sua5/YciO/YrdC/YwlC family)
MRILRIYPTSVNEQYIAEAVERLRNGDTMILPTDTLYAIGCDALNSSAIAEVCRIKGINPQKTPLSVICASLSQAAEYARIDNRAFRIMKDNLPGPFTFLLPAATSLPKAFKGRHTVGIRIPDNPIATALAEALGHPILTTSVPQTDDDSPEAIAMRYDGLASVMIDGGEARGIPSAIIDCTDSSDPQILRDGPLELQ